MSRLIDRSIALLILLTASVPVRAEDPLQTPAAANAAVEGMIREFQGRGQLGDGSLPLPPGETLQHFRMAPELKMELVAAEPEVMQPLSLSFDERGRLWVTQYRQYPFPAGLKVVRYDQHLRAVFDDVPRPPPHHVPGADRITVFEDTDRDGQFDTHKDVLTGLNIATAALTGRGGIWVLNPPYLLFYPDADGDDIPDSDPQVRLRGFGLEDTHAVANSLTWGPDGWLYGANGSTTTGKVSSGTTPEVRFEGQCVWRYHPEQDIFEIFGEGGGNTFSLEFDQYGRLFSGTNHGNTRGMYYPQGSYGEKSFGKHGPLTNPYAFGYFQHLRHEGDQDRFAQTFVIYEGGSLPERYNGRILSANALHHRVWGSDLIPSGSTYRTKDLPNLCESDDTWFRPVDIKTGPDGAVYLADWYDSRLSHVDPRDTWHKTTGRIYRITGENSSSVPAVDLRKLTDAQLIERFTHQNKWHRQTAVRLLSDRLRTNNSSPTVDRLRTEFQSDRQGTLESLWTLASAGLVSETELAAACQHPNEHVRRWGVRLLGDRRTVSPETAQQLETLAKNEPAVQVRSQLASSAKRFETPVALPILKALLERKEDLNDPHLPLLTWWGLEAHCDSSLLNHTPHVGISLASRDGPAPREQVLMLFQDPAVWELPAVKQTIASRLMRRFALQGIQEQAKSLAGSPSLSSCERLLQSAPESVRPLLMSGFLEAYQGREIAALPPGLRRLIEEYQTSLGESNLVLAVRLGDAKAIPDALKVIRNEQEDLPTRLTLIETFGEIEIPQAVPELLALLSSPSSGIRHGALQSLMRYSDPKIGERICQCLQTSLTTEHGLREAGYRVLASRGIWTDQFLREIEQYRIAANSVPVDIVQQLRLHPDEALQTRILKLFGQIQETSDEKNVEIARIRQVLNAHLNSDDQRRTGKQLFTKHCANCHTLFSEGGAIGPNLTGYERTNLDFMLLAIVAPSAGIREEYTQYQLVTDDGRILTGLMIDQSPATVTLRGANGQTTTLPRENIELLRGMTASLMPEGLLKDLSDQDLVALFQYLMQRTPDDAASSALPPR